MFGSISKGYTEHNENRQVNIEMMKMDNLLEKYNVPTPRYTSYPPANYFHEGFTEEDLREHIVASNQLSPQHLSFYIHVPFCPQLCYYCGCNSYAMEKKSVVEAYMNAVKKEIETVLPLLDKKRKIAQIHYGGGTPTAIPLHFLKEINELLLSTFQCIEQPEIAIECHPGHLTEKHWLELIEAGFNRCSIGIQDFDEEVLKTSNRRPSLLPPDVIFSLLRSHGVAINMDFIYGLPGQTVEGFAQTISRAAKLKPDRLVTFSYAHVPWINKNQLILEKAGLPTAENKSAMYSKTVEIMNQHGYVPIGLDHFVLPDDSLNMAVQNGILHRNFQGYCTRATTGQVYAFGVTAISQLSAAYSQNIRNIPKYISAVNEGCIPVMRGYALNAEEQLAREVITTLMCNERLNWEELAKHINTPVVEIKQRLAYDESKLKEMEEDGLINYNQDEIKVTCEGVLFVRNVAAVFDPLMRNGNAKNFSKPI